MANINQQCDTCMVWMGEPRIFKASTTFKGEMEGQISKLEIQSWRTFSRHRVITGWWFGTFFIFAYIGNNPPNWLIFFRGVQTTNQVIMSHTTDDVRDIDCFGGPPSSMAPSPGGLAAGPVDRAEELETMQIHQGGGPGGTWGKQETWCRHAVKWRWNHG